jgi:hypothetical protein
MKAAASAAMSAAATAAGSLGAGHRDRKQTNCATNPTRRNFGIATSQYFGPIKAAQNKTALILINYLSVPSGSS